MYIAVVIVYRSVSRNAHPGDHMAYIGVPIGRQIVDKL